MYTKTPENSISLRASAPGQVRKRDCRDMANLEQDPSWRGPLCRLIRNHDERALVAAFSQIAVEFDCEPEIREIIASFNRLDPATLRAMGASRFSRPPLHSVAGDAA